MPKSAPAPTPCHRRALRLRWWLVIWCLCAGLPVAAGLVDYDTAWLGPDRTRDNASPDIQLSVLSVTGGAVPLGTDDGNITLTTTSADPTSPGSHLRNHPRGHTSEIKIILTSNE